MTYNKDQLFTLLPFITHPPDWFVLGGPADGNEAQCAKQAWPNVKVLAVEPLASNIAWQSCNGFPYGYLLHAALGSEVGTQLLYLDSDQTNGHRCASLDKVHSKCVKETTQVEVYTLDHLSKTYGIFHNAFLWLDIEGSELAALQGAGHLLETRQISYVNVEVLTRNAQMAEDIHKLLTTHDMIHELQWNIHYSDNGQIHHCDRFYIRKDLR